VINFAYKQIYSKHKDCRVLIVGSPGSGKSIFLIGLGWLWEPDFNMNYMVSSREDFIRRIKSKKVGEFIGFDEVHTQLDARTWNEKMQILITQVYSVIRAFRKFICVTVPRKGWVDKRVRELFEMKVEVLGNEFIPKSPWILVRYRVHEIRVEGEKVKEMPLYNPFREFYDYCYTLVPKKLYETYSKWEMELKQKILEKPEKFLKEMSMTKQERERAREKEEEKRIIDKIVNAPKPFISFKGGKKMIDKWKVIQAFDLPERKAMRIKKMAELILKERNPDEWV